MGIRPCLPSYRHPLFRGKRSLSISFATSLASQKRVKLAAFTQRPIYSKFFSYSIFTDDPGSVFLIAANDGQLIDTWARLNQTKAEVDDTGRLLEDLLFNDLRRREGKRLVLFNLSRIPSAVLFDRAVDAFLNHEGWKCCYDEADSETDLFGELCPIRRNLELLSQDQLRSRLRALP